jgi:F-type H+-transporting ATPase subunit a
MSTFSFIYNNLELEKIVLSPLSQFEIRDLLSIDAPILGSVHISITNIGFYLMIGAFFFISNKSIKYKL